MIPARVLEEPATGPAAKVVDLAEYRQRHRFAFDPVAERMTAEGLSVVKLAARVGADRAQLQRSKESGLTVSMADRIAVRGFGCHPCELWPTWWEVTG